MAATETERWTGRLAKLSTLGLNYRLCSAVLYSSQFSVYQEQLSSLELTTAQAFILSLFRSFLIGDAPAVFSLLPLVPKLPHLQSSSIAVWFREDFVFKRQDVTRALSWLARFVKKEGPVIPLHILLVFSSLEEKYQVFSYFKECGDTIGQEMLIYLNPQISRATQARLQDVKDQAVDARPEMVSRGTQTNMTIKEGSIGSKPLSASITKERPIVYAAYQNVESIQTETIFEEPDDFNDPSNTRAILQQQTDEQLTFLVESEISQPSAPIRRPLYLKAEPEVYKPPVPLRRPPYRRQVSSISQVDLPNQFGITRRSSERPRSLQDLAADGRSSPNNIPAIVIRPPEGRRPRSLQQDEIYALDEAQLNATNSRIRPSSSIETFTLERDRKYGTLLRARSSSTLEPIRNNSTLKRNAAAAKAEATKRLMKAAEKGDASAVAAAIAEGANLDQRDGVRRTPLHLAVVGGHEEVLRLLLEAGAAKDKKDSMGRTPLHYTALRGRVGCAQLLIDSGADPNPRDSSGLTPTTLASMKHHSGVAAIIKRKGGQDCSIS